MEETNFSHSKIGQQIVGDTEECQFAHEQLLQISNLEVSKCF